MVVEHDKHENRPIKNKPKQNGMQCNFLHGEWNICVI